VLDMTRLESGHVKPKLDWCDVNDLIHISLRETRKELARHEVATDIASNLPLVRMDFVLMQQALMNLLLNAALHTPSGTAVQVSASAENSTLVLTVADHGPGLPPEVLPRIFEKFYRAPTAPTGGTGLGLSIVKGFVEAQGGQIKAENRANAGAAFTIRLPITEAPPGPPKEERERNSSP
jgi:two-component system sensor histidine kinase KdpD